MTIFQSLYFPESSAVTLFSAKLCPQKCACQFARQLRANHAGAEHEHIQIIMLYSLMCRISVVTKARANPGQFIRGHRCAHSAAANKNAALGLSLENGYPDRLSEIRVIDRGTVIGADIQHFKGPQRLQEGHDSFLHLKTGVI